MIQTQKRLIILIPSFNEEKNLPSVLTRLGKIEGDLTEFGWHADILVVDDGSEDRTRAIAQKQGVDVVSLPINGGYGVALQTGFMIAGQRGYDAAVSIDADGQHQPEDISKLLEVFAGGDIDVVLGSRFVEDTGYKTNFFRKVGIKSFSLVLGLLCGKKIADVTTGFQMVNAEVIDLFAHEYPHDYPDTQVLLLLSLMGFRIKEIPVVVKQRIHGKSMHSSLSSLIYPFRIFLAIVVTLLRAAQIKQDMGKTG